MVIYVKYENSHINGPKSITVATTIKAHPYSTLQNFSFSAKNSARQKQHINTYRHTPQHTHTHTLDTCLFQLLDFLLKPCSINLQFTLLSYSYIVSSELLQLLSLYPPPMTYFSQKYMIHVYVISRLLQMLALYSSRTHYSHKFIIFDYVLLENNIIDMSTILTGSTRTRHMARLPTMLWIATAVSEVPPRKTSSKSLSATSSKSRKRLTTSMDLLALTSKIANDNIAAKPIAVCDYPPGCKQLPSGAPSPESHRSSHRRKLVLDPDDIENSQVPTSKAHGSATSTLKHADHGIDTSGNMNEELVTLTTPPPTSELPNITTAKTVPQFDQSTFLDHLWLSYFVHKILNTQRGLPKCSETRQVVNSKMPEAEQKEFHTCRHVYPYVPQCLYPSSRLDGLPGQYLHMTQIPTGHPIDPGTGLSHTYQI